MVKISKIYIKNFKFYIDDSIDISEKNFLIYGENGVGKSSLYLALYHLFYAYFDNTILENILELKHRNISDTIELTVQFSNYEKIEIIDNSITDNITILSREKIYFLDYRFLEQIIETTDFFETLDKIKNRFLLFDDFFNELSYIEEYKDSEDYDLLIDKRIDLDAKIIEKLNKLKDYTNQIIQELKENFSLNFVFEHSALDREARGIKFNRPKIFIEIDSYRDLKLHFNESKIKILSLALVFAIIRLTQEKNISENDDNLNLLVLDDFLSSLDMGNRLYIMEYVFKHFEGYQKIILTHNSLFFNIVKRLIHVHGRFNLWSYKNIYQSLRDDGFYEPKMLKERDYLGDAKVAFNSLDYEHCGNLLRKEIEKIIAQSTFLFQTGKKEQLEDAIINIRKKNKHFINANDILGDLATNFFRFKERQLYNSHIQPERKLEIMVKKLDDCFDSININSGKLNEILENINFYQTILNQASHYDNQAEFYRLEYNEAIKDVQKLKDIFDEFRKLQ